MKLWSVFAMEAPKYLLVSNDAGTRKLSVNATVNVADSRGNPLFPAGDGITAGTLTIGLGQSEPQSLSSLATTIFNISLQPCLISHVVSNDPLEYEECLEYLCSIDWSTPEDGFLHAGTIYKIVGESVTAAEVEIELTGTIKRYCKLQYSSSIYETWSESGFTFPNSLKHEPLSHISAEFRDVCETCQLDITFGGQKRTFNISGCEWVTSPISIEPGWVVPPQSYQGWSLDENNEPGMPPDAIKVYHRTAVNTIDFCWASGTYNREINEKDSICSETRDFGFVDTTVENNYIRRKLLLSAGAGQFSYTDGFEGYYYSTGVQQNSGYFVDHSGPLIVTGNVDSRKIDGEPQLASFTGNLKKTHRVATPTDPPEGFPNRTWTVGDQTGDPDWFKFTYVFNDDPETNYPVEYTGAASWSANYELLSETFIDLPPGYDDFTEYGDVKLYPANSPEPAGDDIALCFSPCMQDAPLGFYVKPPGAAIKTPLRSATVDWTGGVVENGAINADKNTKITHVPVYATLSKRWRVEVVYDIHYDPYTHILNVDDDFLACDLYVVLWNGDEYDGELTGGTLSGVASSIASVLEDHRADISCTVDGTVVIMESDEPFAVSCDSAGLVVTALDVDDGINFSGGRFCDFSWTGPGPIRVWLGDKGWELAYGQTEIDLADPDFMNGTDEQIQCAFLYQDYPDRHFGVGEVSVVEIEFLTEGSYTVGDFTIFRHPSGQVHFVVFDQAGPWNKSKEIGDFAWRDKYIPKAMLLVDGVVAWEWLSAEVYNETKIYRHSADSLHPMRPDVVLEAPAVEVEPWGSSFRSVHQGPFSMLGGIYTPETTYEGKHLISIPIAVMPRYWKTQIGSDNLPIFYHRWRGIVYGLTTPKSKVTLATADGKTTVEADGLGLFISPALNVTDDASIVWGGGHLVYRGEHLATRANHLVYSQDKTTIPLRPRHWSRLCKKGGF
jgi:hypothetical protein